MNAYKSRGELWLKRLAGKAEFVKDLPASVCAAEAQDGFYIAVVPDPENKYPRARHGEVGLIEGWTLARTISRVVAEDAAKDVKRPIVAVVDVASQAYGRREEAFGIHQALAAAAAAYAKARRAGHPVIALIVGKAMSGAFLAHGYQANRLLAFDDPKVLIHAMGKESAARITLRTVSELDKFASTVPPMAYDIKHYATLGLLEDLLEVSNPDEPTQADVELVKEYIARAIEKTRAQGIPLQCRLGSSNRQATALVQQRMRELWNAAG